MLARTYTTQYPGSTVIMYKSDLIILHTFHITKETHLDSKTKKKIPVLRQEGELPRHAHTRERTAGVHTRTWTNERLCSDHSRVERMGRVDEVTHRHMLQKQSARDLRKIFTSDWFKTSQHTQCSHLDEVSASVTRSSVHFSCSQTRCSHYLGYELTDVSVEVLAVSTPFLLCDIVAAKYC